MGIKNEIKKKLKEVENSSKTGNNNYYYKKGYKDGLKFALEMVERYGD